MQNILTQKIIGTSVLTLGVLGMLLTFITVSHAATPNPKGCTAWQNGQMNGSDNGYGRKVGQDPATHAQNRNNGC